MITIEGRMPNKNYQRGRRKEYKVCNQFRAAGFDIVQRTAGSHSPIDVIAIDKKKRIIKLIQAKPDNFPASQEKKLLLEHQELNGLFVVEFIVE